MSWIEQAKNNLIIVTGDGREYRPFWTAPQKVIEYNISQFEFPGVAGSYVYKGEVKGRKFPLEIYFTGENHLDECDRFELSCNDKRHWVVTHPYYGVINAKPASINIDNTGGNVSKISINLLETIVIDNPRGAEDPSDRIINGLAAFSLTMNAAAVTTIINPTIPQKNLMTQNVTNIYNEGKKNITNTADAENYLNLFNTATSEILNATADVSEAMTSIQAMINAPFQFVDTVKNRVNSLKNQYLQLGASVENVTDLFVTHVEKRVYEHNASLLLGTMAAASVTTFDYQSTEEVLEVINTIVDSYADFIAKIDALQTDTGGDEDSYIANDEAMLQLQDLINYTASNLMGLALESKQERSIVLEQDSNVIILAHRFYGLLPDDSTIEKIISTNGFSLNDIQIVPAGRTVKYYV